MQQVGQFSNDVVIEFFKSGIPGLALLVGAIGTLVGSTLGAWKGFSNGRLNRRIERNVDGRFGEMLKLIDSLSKRADEEQAARMQSEQRMTLALSVVSARTGHPFTDVESLIRAEDLGRPPRRPPSGATIPKRRRNSGERGE